MEIFEFSVYFPSTPSKLKIQVFVLLFLVTLFISPSILSLWELHALSFYKPLVAYSNVDDVVWCIPVLIYQFNFIHNIGHSMGELILVAVVHGSLWPVPANIITIQSYTQGRRQDFSKRGSVCVNFANHTHLKPRPLFAN